MSPGAGSVACFSAQAPASRRRTPPAARREGASARTGLPACPKLRAPIAMPLRAPASARRPGPAARTHARGVAHGLAQRRMLETAEAAVVVSHALREEEWPAAGAGAFRRALLSSGAHAPLHPGGRWRKGRRGGKEESLKQWRENTGLSGRGKKMKNQRKLTLREGWRPEYCACAVMAAAEVDLPAGRPGATIVEFNDFIQHGGLGKNRSLCPLRASPRSCACRAGRWRPCASENVRSARLLPLHSCRQKSTGR